MRLSHAALSFASSPDPYTWEVPDEEMIDRLRAYLDSEHGLALILEVENGSAGFVAAHFEAMDPRNPDRGAVIDLLEVGPEHRGQGFGAHVVRELILQLPGHGITKMQVNVVGSNESAMRFRRRVGLAEQSVTMAIDLPKAD